MRVVVTDGEVTMLELVGVGREVAVRKGLGMGMMWVRMRWLA